MEDKKFNELKAAGENGAKIILMNSPLLLGEEVVWIRDIQDWYIEGSDHLAVFLRWEQDEKKECENEFADHMGSSLPGEWWKPKLVKGGVESKTVRTGKSLHRNDIGSSSCPALQFGLWDGNREDEKGNVRYTRQTHGPLRRMWQPEWKPLSSEPYYLGYLLECLGQNGKPRPYASVALQFRKLKPLLTLYAKENGLNLEDWDSIPVGEAAKDYKCGDLFFSGNLWLVPMDRIEEAARIVMIGEPPQFYKNRSCTPAIQQIRYQYLLDHAAAHVEYKDLQIDGDIKPRLPDFPVSDLLMLEAKNICEAEIKNRVADIVKL